MANQPHSVTAVLTIGVEIMSASQKPDDRSCSSGAAQMHSCQGTQLAPKQRLCQHTDEETDLNMRIHLRRVKLQELPTRTARRGKKIFRYLHKVLAIIIMRIDIVYPLTYSLSCSERCKPTRASTYLIGILGAMGEYRTGQGARKADRAAATA